MLKRVSFCGVPHGRRWGFFYFVHPVVGVSLRPTGVSDQELRSAERVSSTGVNPNLKLRQRLCDNTDKCLRPLPERAFRTKR